jgi:hypothetical protein
MLVAVLVTLAGCRVAPEPTLRSAAAAIPPTPTLPPSTATPLPLLPPTVDPGPWQEMAQMPIKVAGSAISALDGKIYLIGGSDSLTKPSLGKVQVYDTATDT